MKIRMNLQGRRALVTGGAVRIGAAVTRALQAEGVEVLAWQAEVAPAGITLARPLPFELNPD